MKDIQVDTYAAAKQVLTHPQLAQALYDAGQRVMADALITLHGEAHAQRRVAEFAVFNRRFFRAYEAEKFPQTLTPLLQPYVQQGWCDLVELGYRVTMNLTADFAGIDRPRQDTEETETLLRLVKAFSAGATMVHATGDHNAINVAVDAAMAEFDEVFLRPSLARRRALTRQGEILPNDVLSMLVKHDSTLNLSAPVMRREMAFYLQAGAHSTANAATNALHEILTWLELTDTSGPLSGALVQRCVHESLRLHPASPVAWRRALADTQVCGRAVTQGQRVVVDLQRANRDVQVFGDDAEVFNPRRTLPANVWPFGLSFGYGIHACMGRDLDGGVVPKTGETPAQLGIVALFVQTLLQHGARWIAGKPPELDTRTSRTHWGYYPIQLGTVVCRD